MKRWTHHIAPATLALIVLAYVILGTLYAIWTPPWQAPDEPAHYNYVRYLVEQRRLPVLRIGDYDQRYLAEITDKKFDPAYSIESIRYEFHQPPLYYLLAAPVYALTGGRLVPLRLLSVALGTVVVLLAYGVGKAMFPHLTWPALGTAGFVALIPQHIAMTAAVENDALAELWVGLVLWQLVRWLRADDPWSGWRLVRIGVVIGLALLTKGSAYITVPLAVLAVLFKFWLHQPAARRRQAWRPALLALAALLIPALIISLPWFVRNAAVYGGGDITGMGRHDQVVAGQPRTADLIAEQGAGPLLAHWLRTTFHSFWAQFGWMAVPVDARIYTFLALVSAIVALGFLFWFAAFCDAGCKPSPAGLLLTCSAAMTLAIYLGYNLTFYQAQGRYLFPALIPMGIAWSIGLYYALRLENALVISIILGLMTVLGGASWLAGVLVNKWRILFAGLGAAFFGVRGILPDLRVSWLFSAIYAPLLFICAVSPFWFIIPYLTP